MRWARGRRKQGGPHANELCESSVCEGPPRRRGVRFEGKGGVRVSGAGARAAGARAPRVSCSLLYHVVLLLPSICCCCCCCCCTCVCARVCVCSNGTARSCCPRCAWPTPHLMYACAAVVPPYARGSLRTCMCSRASKQGRVSRACLPASTASALCVARTAPRGGEQVQEVCSGQAHCSATSAKTILQLVEAAGARTPFGAAAAMPAAQEHLSCRMRVLPSPPWGVSDAGQGVPDSARRRACATLPLTLPGPPNPRPGQEKVTPSRTSCTPRPALLRGWRGSIPASMRAAREHCGIIFRPRPLLGVRSRPPAPPRWARARPPGGPAMQHAQQAVQTSSRAPGVP